METALIISCIILVVVCFALGIAVMILNEIVKWWKEHCEILDEMLEESRLNEIRLKTRGKNEI